MGFAGAAPAAPAQAPPAQAPPSHWTHLQITVFGGVPLPRSFKQNDFFFFLKHWNFCHANQAGNISNSILPGLGQLSPLLLVSLGTFLVF